MLLRDDFRRVMLVELGIHIVEIYLLNIDLVHVLVDRIAGGDSNVTVLVQTWVCFLRDARLVVLVRSVSLQIVFD